MSITDDFDVSDIDTDFVGDYFNESRRQARLIAFTSQDDNPDDAARALQLEGASGVPASVIYGDLPHFENQFKAKISSAIVSDNLFIAEYLNSHPMNARVSNDDYGQLDLTSDRLNELMKPHPMGEFLKGAVKAYTEGVGTEPLGASAFRTEADIAFAKEHPFAGALAASVASLGELMSRPVKGLLATTAFVTGSREPSAMLEWMMQRGDIGHQPGPMNLGQTKAVQAVAERAAKAIEPWVRRGVEPPVGVDPAIDQIKIAENAEGVSKLSDALKAAMQSTTRERSPERFRDFIAQHGEAEIGIDAKAVAKLYEGKNPGDGTGPLDFVPGIADKLAIGVATGGDVHINVADWLARVDPEVARGLEPDIRVRPGGITATESALTGEPSSNVIDHPDRFRQIPWGENDPTQLPIGEAIRREVPIAWEVKHEGGMYNVYADGELDNAFGHPQDAQNYIDLHSGKTSGLRPPGRTNDNLSQAIQESIGLTPSEPPPLSPFAKAMADRGAKPKPPSLVVARQMPDGTIRIGKPGQIHADLMTKAELATDRDAPDVASSMGYANAEGKFLTREEALDFALKNEPSRAAWSAQQPEFGLDAATYNEATKPKAEAGTFAEAKDKAIGPEQLTKLNIETQAKAIVAGRPVAKRETIDALVKATFERLTLAEISSDKWLRDAAKAQRELATATDPLDAYHASQRRELAVAFAREALDLEKARDQFDRVAKRYREPKVSGASPEYTNAVHDILQRLGLPVKRSIQDVAEGLGVGGLRDFVAEKEGDMRDLHVPEWLADPAFRVDINKLTSAEFAELHDAIKAITHNSRDEMKVYKAGEAADKKAVTDEMVALMKSLGPAKPPPIHGRESQIAKRVRSWWWSGINVESMLNRLDRDDPSGPFYQYITDHFTKASNYRERLVRDFQAKIAQVGHIEGMDDPVENRLWIDPLTGQPFVMSKRNVLGILQNVGNANNLNKLAKGYGLTGTQVMEWLHERTTKEDWDRAQAIGNIFGDIFGLANSMSLSVSGVGIRRLPLAEISTPHGTYAGWYSPAKYDPLRPGSSRKLMGLQEEGYFRATTPQGYAKERTGYIAPVELNLDIVPIRMAQMLHDIAMRPAVIQMSKFFYNPEFERAMTAHYGVHQAKEMIPFLKEIANASNFKSMSEQLGNGAIEFFRQNTIATLIGFNPGTVMKHGSTAWLNSMTEVGALNYLREFKNITMESLSGRETWRMAMEKSEELQRRMKNYVELVQGHGSEINLTGAGGKFMSLREFVMSAGATPVSISDLLSAVPTWAAEYKTQLREGVSEADAVSLANRAVRRAHGSSVLSNKPSIARTNALGATFSSLYGFFSHMLQKQYELAWKARDTLKGQASTPMAHVPDLLKGLMSYVVFPALIEELVTPMTNHDKKSWGMWAAESMLSMVGASMIGVRDFVHAVVNVRDPSAGLIGTSMKAGTDVIHDLGSGTRMSRDQMGNLINHTLTLGGVLTGLTNKEEGKMAEYLYRYGKGLEHPRGLGEFTKGLMFGKPRRH